ncbi:uncharacterized protein LOC120327692 [Styela clava]
MPGMATSKTQYTFPVDYILLPEYQPEETTMQNSIENSSFPIEEPKKHWAAMAVLPIIAFVATGNILVIMAVKLDHKLRSSTNYFLTSLAMADLLVAITVMPPSLAMIINNYEWPFPESLCGIWVMLDVCFSTSSILHLCMISLDRYLALANPFRYNNGGWMSKTSSGGWGTEKRGRMGAGFGGGANKMTKRVAKRILLVWAISIGISLPLPILASQNRDNLFYGQMCVINIPEFAIYGSIVAFFAPLIVMFITYSLTIRTLQKQSKLVACIMGKDGSTHKGKSSTSSSITSRRSVGSTKGTMSGKWTSASRAGNSSLPDLLRSSENCMDLEETSFSNHRRLDSTASGIQFIATPSESRIKTCARCAMLCCGCFSSDKTNRQDIHRELMEMEYTVGSKTTLHKTDSESSDTSSITNHPPVKRSPMITRANLKLAKAVSKLPLKRVSTRRISASMKSRAIATEQRASKVLGMIFTLFCLFWCPFFITNVFSGFCATCQISSCNMELMGNLMNWFVWVGYVSSGVNPCVYTLFSRQFRDTFKKLLCRRYDEIGTGGKHFSRSYPRDGTTGGISTSSFRGRDYGYSISMDPASRRESEMQGGAGIRPTPSVHRSLGESIMIRQHKRSQVTRSADSDALIGRLSRKASMLNGDSGDNTSNEKELNRQWRTTWHFTIDGEEGQKTDDNRENSLDMDTNSLIVKFANEWEQRTRRRRRLMSAPTQAILGWRDFDSRYLEKSQEINESKNSPGKREPEKAGHHHRERNDKAKKNIRRHLSLGGKSIFQTIEEKNCHYNGSESSSNETCESEYENSGNDDVFQDNDLEGPATATSRKSLPLFERTSITEARVRFLSEIDSRNCISRSANETTLTNSITRADSQNCTSSAYLNNNVTKTRDDSTNNDTCDCETQLSKSNDVTNWEKDKRNRELEHYKKFQLSRLDSGMGDSVRNSQSL